MLEDREQPHAALRILDTGRLRKGRSNFVALPWKFALVHVQPSYLAREDEESERAHNHPRNKISVPAGARNYTHIVAYFVVKVVSPMRPAKGGIEGAIQCQHISAA